MRAFRPLAVVLSLGLLAVTSASDSSPASAPRPAAQGTVTKFVPGGSLTVPTSLAGGTLTFDHLSGAVAADSDGTVYVGVCASDFRNRIVVFDKDGHYVRDFEAGNCGTGEPVRIAVGPDHLLYATRIGPNNEIGVFDSTGAQVRLLAGIGQYETITARDIDLDAKGNVYVTIRCGSCTTDSDEVVRLTQAGQVTGRFQPLPPPYLCNGQCVKGVAPAPDGTIWVTTTDPKRELVHLDANGKVLSDAPHLEAILPGLSAGTIRDVDFADGRLYITAHVRAFAVLSARTGELIDSACCDHGTDLDRQVAVAGGNAYVANLHAPASGVSTFGVIGDTIDWFKQTFAYDRATVTAALVGHGCTESVSPYSKSYPHLVSIVRYSGSNCAVRLVDAGNPCYPGSGAPTRTFVGGTELDATPSYDAASEQAVVTIPFANSVTGSIEVQWTCRTSGGTGTTYEFKGTISRVDPSGAVIDARSGRPVASASVALQYAPRPGAPFGAPSLSGFSPQIDPELTGRNGSFGWDVAEGLWRLKATAFGYRRLTSKALKVPPPVTGLRLRLQPDPAQQRLLIDPRGRVGRLALGGKAFRVSGLRVTVRAGRVRAIAIRSRRFQTALGIHLGSREDDLLRAYPEPTTKALLRRHVKSLPRYQVSRATFAVRHGRVVGITLGR